MISESSWLLPNGAVGSAGWAASGEGTPITSQRKRSGRAASTSSRVGITRVTPQTHLPWGETAGYGIRSFLPQAPQVVLRWSIGASVADSGRPVQSPPLAGALRLALLALMVGCLSGCYVARQGVGQLGVIWSSQPVERFLAGPASEQAKAKVRWIQRAQRYAEQTIGMAPTTNYRAVYDTGGGPIVTVVTACRQDRFEPLRWWFPIVGHVPYLGFFDAEQARALADRLRRRALDVSIGGAQAYSTLGWFDDPILSTMLDDEDGALAELIIHELTHGELYLPGQGDFNESLATFVGREGACELLHELGREAEYRRTLARQLRAEQLDNLALELYHQLKPFYDSEPDDALAGRERIFAAAIDRFEAAHGWRPRVPRNNGWVMGRRRYGRTAPFRALFRRVGSEWAPFWAAVRRAAEAPDPIAAVAAAAAPTSAVR